ncbi:hypothetical protein [Mucilaginibacter segetis]|uniref:Carboxypeptidase-like protein n=1 Tax=Mucilaginibacter segetis TaxID=2793071 RepID=A0A934PSA6_9SPHI|nr:hypothetical protein [Mucilaginibacter segetis]MBK0378043.1 hypothetical protein [Mucilaginibacter segetis]
MKYFIIYIISACLLLTSNVNAQSQGLVNGVVYRKISNDRLAQVIVTNLKTHIVTISDEHGIFAIKGGAGDTLLFSKTDYTSDRQIVGGYNMIVYLQPEIKLSEVVIKGQTKKQELKNILGDYRKQGTFYNGKPPVLSFLTNPLTGVYELFGKTPGRARRFVAFAKRELEATEVDRRYTKELVMRVTAAPDSTAQKFMEYYRPSYEDLKTWADYDLIKHIKSNFDYYQKNKDRIKADSLF